MRYCCLAIVVFLSACADGSMSVVEASNQACLLEITDNYKIISRDKGAPNAQQGIGYWENTEIEISVVDMTTLAKQMKNNSNYSVLESQNDVLVYNHNQAGKFRKSCKLNITQSKLKFSLTLW